MKSKVVFREGDVCSILGAAIETALTGHSLTVEDAWHETWLGALGANGRKKAVGTSGIDYLVETGGKTFAVGVRVTEHDLKEEQS